MKTFKNFLNESYKEIEFMCHLKGHKNSTPLDKLKTLKNDLKNIKGVIPLHQDWTEFHGDPHHSLTAIYNSPEHKNKILNAAKKHGVKVDLQKDVSDEYAKTAINGKHEYQVK